MLLKTQKNKIYELLRDRGFDLGEFSFTENPSPHQVILYHRPSSYYLYIEARDNAYHLTQSPGRQSAVEKLKADSFEDVIIVVNMWALSMRRELEAPDLWAVVKSDHALIDAASASEGEEERRFTDDELALISKQLRELGAYIEETHGLDGARQQAIERKLGYLERAAQRQTRTDWLHTFLGVIVSIGIEQALSADAFRDILRFVAVAFRGLLDSGQLPMLPF